MSEPIEKYISVYAEETPNPESMKFVLGLNLIFEINLDKENPLSAEISSSIDIQLIKNAYVILIDDVVNSGKTMQYALTKILEQNTKNIKTVALVDRTHRRFPIKCDFVGLTLSTTLQNRVEVELSEKESYAYLV